MRKNLHKELTLVTLAALVLAYTPLHADRILVIGDSWAQPTVTGLQAVLDENGHMDVIAEETPFIGQSWEMKIGARLNDITSRLGEGSEVIAVHISIGGNDFGGSEWAPFWAGTAAETILIQEIIDNVEVVVDHILSFQPDIHIMWSSYDFPRPHGRGTPLEINTFWMTFAEQAAEFAANKPGLSFVNLNGTLQVAYGFDGVQHTAFDPGFVIPPGDPSLPNPVYPSPFEQFIPNEPYHLFPGGYKTIAQAQYELYYEPLLNSLDVQINAGHAGAWFDPLTSGQGLLIDVESESQFIFLAWFTFTDAASSHPNEQQWYTAQGNFSGNTAELILSETLGGQFNHPQAADTQPVGTVSISFSDCEHGQMAYSIDTDGRQGTIPLQRLVPGGKTLCEALTTAE